MRQWVAVLLWCWASLAGAASCGWVAVTSGVRLIGLNQVGPTISLPSTPRLAMNSSDCSVWAAAGATLYRITDSGTLSQTIDLASLQSGFGTVKALAVDSFDQGVWLTDGARLLRLDDQGRRSLAVTAPGVAVKMLVGPDRHLWLLGANTLWRINEAGQTLAGSVLTGQLSNAARYLALDPVGRRVWVADDASLVQFDFSQLGQPRRLFAAAAIRALAVEPISGLALVLHDDGIAPYSRDLKPLSRITASLPGSALDLAYDAREPGWWLAGKDGLIRFALNGQLQSRLGGLGSLAELAQPVLSITPTLSLLQPPSDGLSNDPRLTLAVTIGALCQGQPCSLGENYAAGTLTATLDQKAVTFGTTDASGVRRYTPESALTEGSHRVTAQFTDPWGKRQAQLAANFSIDLTPPQFLSLEPVDGSSSAQPRITVRGKVDDAEAYITLTDYESYALKGEHPAKQSFTWELTLQPGPNTLQLIAMDKAGNKTQKTLHLTLTGVTPALSVAISTPGNGTAVDDDRISVTGSVFGPAEAAINVNGVLAVRDGNKWWAENVPLKPGLNFVRATATDQTGQTAVAMVNVLSSGPAAVKLIASPTSGLAPLTVRFVATSTQDLLSLTVDPLGIGNTLKTEDPEQGVAYSYKDQGHFLAKVGVIAEDGSKTERTILISVQTPEMLDQLLRNTLATLLSKLRNRDIEGALQHITGAGQEKYREIFEALRPTLPSVVDRFGELHQGRFGRDMAEYFLLRKSQIGIDGYYIYFLRSEDGVWRIEGM